MSIRFAREEDLPRILGIYAPYVVNTVYSLEYDAFADKEIAEALLTTLAERSGGYVLSDPLEVFENAVEFLHIVIDPRILFAILIIVLFLVDIAARKFKWKWPHEIIRERKQKQLVGK